jgi:hypothetical protein
MDGESKADRKDDGRMLLLLTLEASIRRNANVVYVPRAYI